MKKIVIVAISFLLLSAMNASAQCTTTVSGVIDGQTWTLEGIAYCVDGDVSVVNLVIEPGVIVEFLGGYKFDVPGTLVSAVGVSVLMP